MDLDFKEVPKYTLSASEIRTYADCARKRYYSSRDYLALKSLASNKALDIGKAIHNWFEIMYQGNQVVEQPVLEQEDKKVYDNITNNYYPQLIEDLDKYEVVGCEVRFQLNNWPIQDVMYHGFIDMVVVEKATNKVFFFEHKTCKDFRPEIYNRFDIQLHLYSIYGLQFAEENGYEWGGVILNEVKKAKTAVGYANHRMTYLYSIEELQSFTVWLTKKTEAAISPNNKHEPCNNFMNCKMCEYSSICLKYGYEVPTSTDEIIENIKNEQGEACFEYSPREEKEDS